MTIKTWGENTTNGSAEASAASWNSAKHTVDRWI